MFYDFKNQNIYFLFINESKEYKFFDDNLYILNNNKELIEIELNTLKMKYIIIENEKILDFIDLDSEKILLLISQKFVKEKKRKMNHILHF